MRQLIAILGLLLCPSLSLATCGTISRVGSAKATSTNGTDTTVTITYSPTSGNSLVVGVGASATLTISSVTDNGSGSVYTKRISNVINSDGFAYIWTGIAGTGVSNITVNFSAGPSLMAGVTEYSGSCGFGQIISNQTSGATSLSQSLTTQATNNWISSVFSLQGNVALSAGTGNLNQSAITGSSSQGIGDNSATTVLSTLSNSVTWTGSLPAASVGIELSTSPINYVQTVTKNTGNCSGSTCTTTFLNLVQANDLILCTAFDGGPNLTDTCTDGSSNTYTHVKPGGTNNFCALATDGDSLTMSYAIASAQSLLAVTISPSDGNALAVRTMMIDISGVNTSTPLDQVSTCTDTTGVTSLTTSSISTTSANELLLGEFGNDTNTNGFTAGANYFKVAVVDFGMDESRTIGSTGSYTASATQSSTAEIAGFVVSFIAVTPALSPGTMKGGSSKRGGGTVSQ